MFTPHATAVTRLVLGLVACAAGAGVLTVTVSGWGRSWLAVAVALAAAGLAGAAAAWVWRPVSTPPIVGADGKPVPGSVAAIEKLRLGGVNQWVVLRGRDTTNPVLLMLAGGPGGSELGSFRKHNGALEDHFTVVHWEQRGAGKSFPLLLRDHRHMTPHQYVADGLELAAYLWRRFGKDKIFLVGHSWGTFLGDVDGPTGARLVLGVCRHRPDGQRRRKRPHVLRLDPGPGAPRRRPADREDTAQDRAPAVCRPPGQCRPEDR
jgi:hypothetical protein